MRAVLQRVKSARVTVDSQLVGEIGPGILTLLGIGHGDTEAQLSWLIEKVVKMRIFEDEQGKLNLSMKDKGFAHLIVSQFTLYADCQKGNRPSFMDAASPSVAEPLYLRALELSRAQGVVTAGGKFQADMKVELINDGPVTIVIEAPK